MQSIPAGTKQVRFSHTHLLHGSLTPSPKQGMTALPSNVEPVARVVHPSGSSIRARTTPVRKEQAHHLTTSSHDYSMTSLPRPAAPRDLSPQHQLSLPGPSPYKFTLPARTAKIAATTSIHTPLRAAISIHPALAFSHSPLIQWDLSSPPSAATARGSHSVAFTDSVSDLSLSSLTIMLPPRCGQVEVSPAHRNAAITIAGVLTAIYDALRENLKSASYHSLPRSEQKLVTSSYEQRYRRIKSDRGYAWEKSHGVKKVDLLMGKTRFMGLTNSPNRPELWILHVS